MKTENNRDRRHYKYTKTTTRYTAGPQPAEIFGRGKMISTCCCT